MREATSYILKRTEYQELLEFVHIGVYLRSVNQCNIHSR